MSHWVKGKLSLACDVSVLQAALIKIMPEWANSIEIDSVATNWYDRSEKPFKAGLVVKGGGSHRNDGQASAKGLRYTDLGFIQTPDGSWEVSIDPLGLPFDKGEFEKEIVNVAEAEKTRKQCVKKGFRIVEDKKEGKMGTGKTVIRVYAPVGTVMA